MAIKSLTMTDALARVGTAGIKRIGAYIYEEFLPELRGRIKYAKFREMTSNDPAIGRGLRACKWELTKPDWSVEGGSGTDIEEAREFLSSLLDDMSDTWREVLWEALSCMEYGASLCSMVYKQRQGTSGKYRSKYDDGLVGWRKWVFIGQETWDGWEWDEDGDVAGVWQNDQYAAQGRTLIPLNRSLHFKIEGRLGDPEGESILRTAYPIYCLKKEAQYCELIRISRDATGVPHFAVQPEGPDLWDDGATVQAQKLQAMRAYLESAGTALRMDDQVTVITPALVDFKLVSSPGSPQVDVDKTIRRYDWQMLGAMLAQFLELGQAAHGSFSKSESDQDLFLGAMAGILQHRIAETINRFEIPRLFELNAGSFNLDELPYLVPGDLQVDSILDMAEGLSQYATAGLIVPDPPLEAWLRQRGKLPPAEGTEETTEEVGKRASRPQYTIRDFAK